MEQTREVPQRGQDLNTREAAVWLGVATRTLQKWVHDGRARASYRTLGGQYRWSTARLTELQRQLYREAGE